MSTNYERRSMKSPGGDCHDLFGAEFLGSPCHHRVLKPPGGGTSDIFGGSDPAAAAAAAVAAVEKPIVRKKSAQTSSIVLGDNVTTNGSRSGGPTENGHSNSKQGTCNERLFGPPLESSGSAPVSNAAPPAAKTNGELRVITNGNDHPDALVVPKSTVTNGRATNGEVKQAVAAAPTASRNRVPPGGYSSGLW